MATKKKDDDDTKAKAQAKKGAKAKDDAEEQSGEVDESKLSYGEIAALSNDPVVTTTRVMQQFPPKEPVDKGVMPDTVFKTEVIWGPLPKDPPPKPDRAAATIESHIMERPGAPPKRPPSIGSMQPPGGKR